MLLVFYPDVFKSQCMEHRPELRPCVFPCRCQIGFAQTALPHLCLCLLGHGGAVLLAPFPTLVEGTCAGLVEKVVVYQSDGWQCGDEDAEPLLFILLHVEAEAQRAVVDACQLVVAEEAVAHGVDEFLVSDLHEHPLPRVADALHDHGRDADLLVVRNLNVLIRQRPLDEEHGSDNEHEGDCSRDEHQSQVGAGAAQQAREKRVLCCHGLVVFTDKRFKGTVAKIIPEGDHHVVVAPSHLPQHWHELLHGTLASALGEIHLFQRLDDGRTPLLLDARALFVGEACAQPRHLLLDLLVVDGRSSERHLRDVAEFGLRGNLSYADNYMAFPDSPKHLLKANSRGLCCHWMAGNVQILGLFALVQCIITKNVNLLKVSSHDEGVFAGLLSAFEGLSYTTKDGYTISGDDLLKTIGVVYFSRHAVKLGEQMSKNAEVRIAWGGREAVETVASYPSKYDCETVIFGPKLSFAVVSKEMLADEQAAKKLARRVSVDVSVFDQSGCASAHNLFIEKGGAVSPERFCQILNESMGKTEIQIPKPTMSPEQVSAVHSIRGVYDFCGLSMGSETMSYSILLDDKDELHKPVYSRVLFVHAVDSIMQAVKHVTEDIQTIGVEATPEQAVAFAEAATPNGAVRFPQIGRMLNFEMPWDGIVLIDRLVKWNTLMGPLV